MNNKNIKKLGRLIEENFYPIIISIIVFFIALVNFKQGTFLSGWDTLHPEFNLSLNIKRAINIWSTNEGLGTFEGHSIISDLPRIIILWFFNFLFPLNTLRYIYIFICLLIGPLGIYFLINFIYSKRQFAATKILALVAALYYLFNLSTVQQFYVPFEMFTTQYAFLPWIILSSLFYLKKPSKKNAILFILLTLISTPQAYAPQLWYAFFGTYLVFLMLFLFLYERNKNGLKKILSLITLTIVVNAFWLLPNLYFVKTASLIPQESKQNRIYSQEYKLKNRENGYLKDVALIKGFYLNWLIADISKDRFVYLMPEWKNHSEKPMVKIIGYLLFSLTIIGIIFSFTIKDKLFISFFPFFLIPFVFLMNHTPPFEQFFDYLSRFSLFKEGLRFVFTKFSILLLFSYVLYFAYALSVIYFYLRKQLTIATISLLIILGLFVFAYPITQGNLISEKMKIFIPQEYFDFYKFMDKQQDGLILTLPMHSFSGWQYYKWGYQGSGFIWFGLKQPILDRDFDRWNPHNEQAYRELSYAVYARDEKKFTKNLSKYNVKYIVWDKNNIPIAQKGKNQLAFTREIGILLDQLQRNNQLTLLKAFNNILVYKNNSPLKNFITIQELPEVQPFYKWSYFDQAYDQIGDYVTHLNNAQRIKNKYVFPYRDFIDYNDQVKPNFFYKLRSVQDNNIRHLKPETIIQKNGNKKGIKLLSTIDGSVIDFSSKNNQIGVNLDFLDIPHNNGYILVFDSKNIKGLPLRFCFRNIYSQRCELYDEVTKNKDFNYDYFFIPPLENGGLGYQLHIDNLSFGNYPSHNQLRELFVIPVSVDILKQYNSQGYIVIPKTLLSINEKKIQNYGNFIYRVNINNLLEVNSNSYVTFNQSYNSGWKAYQIQNSKFRIKNLLNTYFPFIFGKELKEHVLVNNWANGWKMSQNQFNRSDSAKSVVIIFWPQYLVFIGLGLLLITFLFILFYQPKVQIDKNIN